jgi:hypothetical protein
MESSKSNKRNRLRKRRRAQCKRGTEDEGNIWVAVERADVASSIMSPFFGPFGSNAWNSDAPKSEDWPFHRPRPAKLLSQVPSVPPAHKF